MNQIIECVPNFSEGRNKDIINSIVASFGSKIDVLNVDMGYATNRTVITFVGSPEDVFEAAYNSVKRASELIDMRQHVGEHPRFGACDVLPLIPVSGIKMDDVVVLARKLGKKIGDELDFPVYCYEYAAFKEERRNLAIVRSGEYEGLETKLQNPQWKPDFGPTKFVPKIGTIAVGARDFLIAVNYNLNTTSVRRANAVAFDVREFGRPLKKDGVIQKDEKGVTIRQKGTCPGTKAIGWFIEEYGISQVSMNLTKIALCPLHIAFEEVRKSARNRGLRVTGVEIVGVVPECVILDAGKYFLKQQQRSLGVPKRELIKIAIKSMGLSELFKFDPDEKIIEYRIQKKKKKKLLIDMNVRDFVYEVACEKTAPGGGSVAALISSLGVGLTSMVANIGSHKRGWDDKWEVYSDLAEEAHQISEKLLELVDKDTNAFAGLISAFQIPKKNKEYRDNMILKAYKNAVNVPLRTMKLTKSCFDVIKKVAEIGPVSAISDVGSAAICAVAGVKCAYLNVKINLNSDVLKKEVEFTQEILKETKIILDDVEKFRKEVNKCVARRIKEV